MPEHSRGHRRRPLLALFVPEADGPLTVKVRHLFGACPGGHLPLKSTDGAGESHSSVNDVLRNAPQWVRIDLASKDAQVRGRAEEVLAAMIGAVLAKATTAEIA